MGRKAKSYGQPKVVVSRALVHVPKIRYADASAARGPKKRVGGPSYLRTRRVPPGATNSAYKQVPGWKSTRLVHATALNTTAVWLGSYAAGYQRGYTKAATATPAGRAKHAAMQKASYNRGFKKGRQVGGKIGGA